LTRQHGLIHGRDLVGKRVYERRVDRKDWIKQVGEVNALPLRDQPKKSPVAVEAPGSPLLDYLKTRLVITVQEYVRDPAGRGLVG
jgi:hypothetical protein